jgi:hypothetical protein
MNTKPVVGLAGYGILEEKYTGELICKLMVADKKVG